jgi:hypothetical protein
MSAPIVPTEEKDLTKFAFALQQLAAGRSNAVGSVTLTANVGTTTVTAVTCGSASTVLLFPVTASAATEFGAGTLRVGTISNGSFIITHVNSATADRTFRWVALG